MAETEIPEDVMKRIDAAVEKYGDQPVLTGIKMAMADVVKELVAEERERCAKVAEETDDERSGWASYIAKAIRRGSP